jgi:hypothetical protein
VVACRGGCSRDVYTLTCCEDVTSVLTSGSAQLVLSVVLQSSCKKLTGEVLSSPRNDLWFVQNVCMEY